MVNTSTSYYFYCQIIYLLVLFVVVPRLDTLSISNKTTACRRYRKNDCHGKNEESLKNVKITILFGLQIETRM